MKKILALVGSVMAGGAALAQEGGGSGSGTFDPSTLLSQASTTVTSIATAVGGVLVAAAAIYLAFIGWRKFREACNRV